MIKKQIEKQPEENKMQPTKEFLLVYQQISPQKPYSPRESGMTYSTYGKKKNMPDKNTLFSIVIVQT